ncbi:hypothetical protein WICPIJ_003249 [Wickerhamomyces pijperi]|uniref:Uncharacterized protein n=1 Tax=Wickerhamomyces pijperi TaxID=599730 RepID=A0A9P8TNW2_WICPI|nr:hypothetical protein WICPIJ_003249 [Wickerhamomyces pijperi]
MGCAGKSLQIWEMEDHWIVDLMSQAEELYTLRREKWLIAVSSKAVSVVAADFAVMGELFLLYAAVVGTDRIVVLDVLLADLLCGYWGSIDVVVHMMFEYCESLKR